MGYTSRESIIVAHAVLGGLLGVVIWPVGAIVGRYLRLYYSRWVRIHYWITGVIAIPVLIVTFALGRYHVGNDEGWKGTHYTLSLVLLILGILQPVYGTIIHQARFAVPISGDQSVLRYGHPILGITIIILGYIQVYTGFAVQWGHTKPSPVPRGTLIAWAVLLALGVAVYLAGFSLLPRQWRARKASTAQQLGSKEEMTSARGGINDRVV